MKTYSLDICNVSESLLPSLARQLALCIPNYCWIGVKGELGSGKTTLFRCLIQNLGFTGSVKSPTYEIIRDYRWDNSLLPKESSLNSSLPNLTPLSANEQRAVHMDWYRLNSYEELEQLGLENYADISQQYIQNICFVEWYELFPNAVEWDLCIHITYLQDGRNYQFVTDNFSLYQSLIKNLVIGK